MNATPEDWTAEDIAIMQARPRWLQGPSQWADWLDAFAMWHVERAWHVLGYRSACAMLCDRMNAERRASE